MDPEYLERIIKARLPVDLSLLILRLNPQYPVNTRTILLRLAGVDLYDWIQN